MFKKAMIASAVLAAAFGAQAQSAGWTVIGTVNPTPCTVSITGGGVADYGTLTATYVKARTQVGTVGSATAPRAYSLSALGTKNLPLVISCATPTKFALSLVDNGGSPLWTDGPRWGLGTTSDGTKIGYYEISLADLKIKPLPADALAAPATRMYTAGVATSSSVYTAFNGVGAGPGFSVGFSATAAATTPDSLSEVSGNLQITNALLNKDLVDSATTAITLAGKGTLTLVSL